MNSATVTAWRTGLADRPGRGPGHPTSWPLRRRGQRWTAFGQAERRRIGAQVDLLSWGGRTAAASMLL